MKGILFKEPMFKAVVEGIKTQTRRIVPTKEMGGDFDTMEKLRSFVANGRARYKKGETVYLKEPYNDDIIGVIYYRYLTAASKSRSGWKNKLFMPEKYARYFIKIKNVRVERLQEITEEDSIAEGVASKGPAGYYDYKRDHFQNAYATSSFQSLWIVINGEHSWYENPWVFVYEFELTGKSKS